jgi:hypothetical protein
MTTTSHTHPVVFGRKVDGCPRCTELRLGVPARQWRNQRSKLDTQRLRDIRAHNCATARCGVVCTFGDY